MTAMPQPAGMAGMTGGAQVATRIAEVRPQARADVSGVIRSARAMSIGGSPACSYALADGSGELDLIFLGRVSVPGLTQGSRCRAEGRAASRDDHVVLWNPRYWLEPASAVKPATGPADGSHPAGAAPGLAADLSAGEIEADPASGPGAQPAGPRRAVRVLVVDDDAAIRRVLKVALTARGYLVDQAGTAGAAVEQARSRPDLIILDIGLPDANGLAAIQAIRTVCNAPVVVISAREVVAARTAAMAAGASDYLAKPFAMDRLLATIQQVERPAAGLELAGAAIGARG